MSGAGSASGGITGTHLQRCLSSLAAAPELGHAELADTESGPLLVLRHLAPLSDADLSALTAFCAEHNTALYLQAVPVHRLWQFVRHILRITR